MCVLAAHASAADARIIPGFAIADVKIGMTLAQTKKILGKPQTLNARRQLAGHRRFIEYGWNFSSVWVGFVNTNGVLHSVLIGTSLAREKTKEGIGVGTPVKRLRGFPRMTCFTGTRLGRASVLQPAAATGTSLCSCRCRSATNDLRPEVHRPAGLRLRHVRHRTSDRSYELLVLRRQ